MATEWDKATGLPRLPDGYYWRVKSGAFGIYPWVYLMRKSRFWFDYEIDSMWTDVSFNSVREEVEYLCGRLADRFYSNIRRDAEFSKIKGDYPPKSINANNQDA